MTTIRPDFYLVGLTGGLACGKTQASECFSAKKVDVLDVDIIVRQLHHNLDIQACIIKHFGNDILDNNQKLHRAKLRELIFKDSNAKEWLEQLLHPLVFQSIQQWQLASESPYGILVAPLLIETGLHHWVDRILVISCSPQSQLQRAQARDQISAQLAQQIINQQLDQQTRLAYADDLIDNNGSLAELSQQVDVLHAAYLRLAQQQAQSV